MTSFYTYIIKSANILLLLLLANTITQAQRVSIYDDKGNIKTSGEIKADEAANKKNATTSTSSGGNISGGGTSKEFRKEVRNVKADNKKRYAESKKKMKSFDQVGVFIYKPGGPGGYKIVSKDGKWGIIQWMGELAYDNVPLVYDEIRENNDLTFTVKQNNKWGLINEYGTIITPIEFEAPLQGPANSMLTVKDGNEVTIDRTGKILGAQPIIIHGQTWSASNLNTDVFRNGDIIPEAKTVKEWQDAADQQKAAWCYYDNETKNGRIHGKLYNWYAVNDSRGLAPKGYHIPTQAEFKKIGTEIQSYGFGTKGGERYIGKFTAIGEISIYWTATETNTTDAVYAHDKAYYENSVSKATGLSVRCIKD
ncbi:MAG: fibrobacter succinogenes major paralogous domain-containing protein [Bacteroidota bacterium]